MAGSFDVFRKYQRSLLAAVAILAMLAFFVLPPFLQMAPDAGAVDPLVAAWQGGGIREGELQRAVAMRMVLNQFLRDAMAASGRDPGAVQVLGESEVDVVRTLLLAREAEANGIVIGNNAVNQFLAQWTNNMVRPEQLEALISGRRLGQMAVSTADVFEALRTVLAADRMRQFAFTGFVGDPPAARWDIFRRLEQEATVEVVPVVVESLAGDVPVPPAADLRAFFDRHKDALPIDRSPDPGFKEPHRISYDWVVAKREQLDAAAAKDVTDEQIQAFYDENKIRLYRAKPAADSADEKKEEAEADKKDEGDDKAEEFEPLDKVRDDIRKRLAATAVTRRIDGVYRAIEADVAGFARDLARWRADGGDEKAKPVPPNADAIASQQGLEAGHAAKRTAGEAMRDGGVGASFQLAPDPQSPLGFRQARWTDLFFLADRPLWRPVETRDVAGDRFLAWKTEDFPAFVPEFDTVRADVERAWRIVEARPLARGRAEEIATAAQGGRALADVVAGRSGAKLEAATVGPFTWLSRGATAFGSPVTLSQPEGLEMPGEDFMRAVFALEPGGTAVAFNEPRTVCYAIRLVGYTPADDDLRKRFVDSTTDQRRLGAVAEQEQSRAFQDWLVGVEKRAGLEWKRPPQ